MTLPRSEPGPEAAPTPPGAGRADERGDVERAGGERTRRVSRSVELDAAPAEVWDALTEAALLAEWLADEVEIDAEPGGEIVCRYADGEERRGEVELVEEAARLAWSWRRDGGGPSRVELVLDAVAERTRLTVIETAPLGAAGPLLRAAAAGPRSRAAGGPLLAAPAGAGARLALAPTWGPELVRLGAAVRLVRA